MDTVTVPRSEPTRAKHAEGMVAYQQKGMRAAKARRGPRRGQVFHYHITSDILTAPWLDPYD